MQRFDIRRLALVTAIVAATTVAVFAGNVVAQEEDEAVLALAVQEAEQAEQAEQEAQEVEEQSAKEAKMKEAHMRMQEAMSRAREAMGRHRVELEGSGHALRRIYEPLARMRGAMGSMPKVMQFHGADHDPIAMLKMHAEELELTDEQTERFGEIKRAHERAAIEREAAMKIAKLDLEPLMSADEPDLGAVQAQLERLADLKVQDQMADLRLKSDLHAVLTPEQLEKAKKLGEGSMRNVFLRRTARGDADGNEFIWSTPDMEHFEFRTPDDMEFGWVDEFEGPMMFEGEGDFMFAPGMEGKFDIKMMPEGGAFFLKDGEFENLDEMIESGELEHIESPDGDVYIWVSPDGEEHRIEIRKRVVKKEKKEQEEQEGNQTR